MKTEATKCVIKSLKTRQTGISLLEVLVSLLLLAMAVLGYIALQATSVKLTDESAMQTQAVVHGHNLAESIRINPTGLASYVQAFSNEARVITSTTIIPPSKDCGLLGNNAGFCTPTELAKADSYLIQTALIEQGLTLKLLECGRHLSTTKYCAIIAWGDTQPTIGNDVSSDCVASLASSQVIRYQPNATCFVMGVN